MADNNTVELATPIAVQEPVVHAMRQVVQDIHTVVSISSLRYFPRNQTNQLFLEDIIY